jgi:hypothetical protein
MDDRQYVANLGREHKEIVSPKEREGMAALLSGPAKRLPVLSIETDEAFRARVKHELRGRTLGAFVAATGLGPAQAATMSKDEISDFVRLSEQNADNDISGPNASWQPQPVPFESRFIMVG